MSTAPIADPAVDGLPSRRVRVALGGVALAVVATIFAGNFLWTDDEFPAAPFRMFSYANSQNGVIRTMRFEADLASGAHVKLDASTVGLRRAELEEQTPSNRRVPDEKLAAIVAVYNERFDDDIVHLQVIVRRIRLIEGIPQPETIAVIGDWATPAWTGPRITVDLPEADPWPGYGS